MKSSAPVGGSFHPDLVQEFNPNIILDNLKQDDSPAVSRRITGNSPPHLSSPAHSIQLAAKMVRFAPILQTFTFKIQIN